MFENCKKRVDYKKELKLAINSNYLLKLGNDIEIFVDCFSLLSKALFEIAL